MFGPRLDGKGDDMARTNHEHRFQCFEIRRRGAACARNNRNSSERKCFGLPADRCRVTACSASRSGCGVGPTAPTRGGSPRPPGLPAARGGGATAQTSAPPPTPARRPHGGRAMNRPRRGRNRHLVARARQPAAPALSARPECGRERGGDRRGDAQRRHIEALPHGLVRPGAD